jgi:hypothetical protein
MSLHFALCSTRRPSRGARQKGQVLVDISQSKPIPVVAPGVLGGKFMLQPEEVQQLMQQYSVGENELLQMLITPASQLARPPISSYHVGCARPAHAS